MAVVKLVHGPKTLNINDGTIYDLGGDFVPPASMYSLNMAAGTSANRTGGSKFISKRANDRELSFTVWVKGTGAAEIQGAVRRLRSFLNYAEDSTYKFYLEYTPDDALDYKPLWGQGNWLRYQVKNASVDVGGMYGIGDFRKEQIPVLVTLLIGPYAEGLPQRLGTASGGIAEDWIGASDRISRGTIIAEASPASGNEHTNPIFGNATYNTNWDNSANCTDTANYDPEFILFGDTSVKLWASAAALYTQELTLDVDESFTLSYYIKLPDSSAVDYHEVYVHYAGTSYGGGSATYTNMGDGWYRISKTVTGTGDAQPAGITLAADTVLYMDGAQCEQVAYLTPFFYGDMLGCAWASTAHASASTRTAAELSVASGIFERNNATYRVIWKADRASSALTADIYLLAIGTDPILYYDQSEGQWKGSDGALVAYYDATFAVGDIIVFHLTCGSSGVKLYINGSAVGTPNANFTPYAAAAFNIGSSSTPDSHCNGTFLGVANFDRVMSATEISNDYDDIYDWISQDSTGKRYEAIPYLWTKDGDNVVDNCYIAASKNNFCVIGGIQGTAPADNYIQVFGNDGNFNTYGQIAISQWVQYYYAYYNPGILFNDWSGSADASPATEVGGEYEEDNIGTTEEDITDSYISINTIPHYQLDNISLVPFARIRADSADDDLTVRWLMLHGSNDIYSEYKTLNMTTGWLLYYLDPLILSPSIDIVPISFSSGFEPIYPSRIQAYLYGYCSPGAADLDIDYVTLMPRPIMLLDVSGGDGASWVVNISKGKAEFNYLGYTRGRVPIKGDVIECLPNRYNILYSLMGSDAIDPDITYTMLYNAFSIIPRYEII